MAAPARHPLHWSLLRVRGGQGQVVGAAFLAGKDRLLTCAHVVAEALDVDETSPKKPTAAVELDFYRDGTPLTAEVEVWVPARTDDGGASGAPQDIALLQLIGHEAEPRPGRPARLLAPRHLSGHRFLACGFPGGEQAGVWAHGVLGEQRANGTMQIESPGTAGFRVQLGFSGSPVWDQRERGVVGMVVSSWRDTQTRAAFVIPTDALVSATGDKLRAGRSVGPFGLLTAGLSQPRPLIDFLHNYLGTPERPAPFGGRGTELEELDRWLSDERRPYRLVAAPAGQGKSALLAHWAMDVAESDRGEVILAPVSLRFGTNQRADVEHMVIDRLRYLLPDAGGIGQQDLPTILSHERDPDERPLVLIFDSIDEASGWRPERDLPFPPYPAAGVRVLVSARVLADRDPASWLAALGWEGSADSMSVGSLDHEGIREVLTGLKVETAQGPSTDELVAALYSASDGGDPLLVSLFAMAIGPGGFVAIDELPDVTAGLGDYFDLWWEGQREYWSGQGRDPVEETERATRLFGILASALGPLTVDELSELTAIPSAAGLQERLSDLGRWVIAVGGKDQQHPALAFAHSRLRDYWRQQKMTDKERQDADHLLVEFGRRQLQRLVDGAEPRSAAPYALRYYAAHLENAQADPTQFDSLVCREWWQAHRAVTGSDEGFLNDIAYAWHQTDEALAAIGGEEDPRVGSSAGYCDTRLSQRPSAACRLSRPSCSCTSLPLILGGGP